MEETPLSNKLAALALAITDATLAETDDLAPTAVAALITIRDREPMSIGEIAHVVGLSHSAAVRLVDRLEKDWLVRRQRRIGREVMVEITARGRRRAQQLQENRMKAVADFLSGLKPDQQFGLNELIDRIILERANGDTMIVGQFCRMCDRNGCNCGLHNEAERA
jgi:DNA-binding MarR family transcriptional regulator